MKASSVKELQIFCAFVEKIKWRLGVGWRWMWGGISEKLNHHSNFNNISFAAHIWKEMSFKGEVMLQLSLIFDSFHTSETWMQLYTLKRDALMCAIPYLTCDVNSLLLLPKSNAETQLKIYLFIYFTGHKGKYTLPFGSGINRCKLNCLSLAEHCMHEEHNSRCSEL